MHPIKHLYSRAGFGLSVKEWKEKESFSRSKAINELFDHAERAAKQPIELNFSAPSAAMGMDAKKNKNKRRKALVAQQNIQWINRMADVHESALLEKMMLFWLGHFACQPQAEYALHYTNILRTHALGNFREFVHAIARSPAMIKYLNNQQNRKKSPNENFARELMELFTIGRGHYTEQDIKEAARAFTGWTVEKNQPEFRFSKFHHDYSSKKFMGKSGDLNGEDVIDIILKKPAVSEFIVTKIYRFFVNDRVDKKIITSLSNQFFESDYDIRSLMYTIFTSDWFYDKKNVANQIKSPVYLLANLLRTVDVKFKDPYVLIKIQQALGQMIFVPPNVAGWQGGKAWIDNTTLLFRLNLSSFVFRAAQKGFLDRKNLNITNQQTLRQLDVVISVKEIESVLKKKSNEEIFDALQSLLLNTDSSYTSADFNTLLIKKNTTDFIKTTIMALTALPEFQVC